MREACDGQREEVRRKWSYRAAPWRFLGLFISVSERRWGRGVRRAVGQRCLRRPVPDAVSSSFPFSLCFFLLLPLAAVSSIAYRSCSFVRGKSVFSFCSAVVSVSRMSLAAFTAHESGGGGVLLSLKWLVFPSLSRCCRVGGREPCYEAERISCTRNVVRKERQIHEVGSELE